MDHPRIRGEHSKLATTTPPLSGSSPHTRGALGAGPVEGPHGRIIPAYAGSTFPCDLQGDGGGDHPRIRGEHRSRNLARRSACGSSPHTRGAPSAIFFANGRKGIIPAYAGSTRSTASASTTVRDHPRIRGEHDDSDQYSIDGLGSSPHTRGAPVSRFRGAPGAGIIPAYAGSTLSPSGPGALSWDHPRIRGEHGVIDVVDFEDQGSSPHTRGAPGKPA